MTNSQPLNKRLLTFHAKPSYFRHMFHTYALVSCLMFFAFSAFLIYYVNNDYKNTLTQVQKENMNQVYDMNQTVLLDISTICNSMLSEGDLARILYKDDFNTNLALTARTLNHQLTQASSLIQSVYFINFQTDTIIDAYSRSGIEAHYDQELFTFLSSQSPRRTIITGLPRYVTRANYFTSVPVFSLIFYNNSNGALVINIDYNKYIKTLSLSTNSYQNMFLISSQGEVIASSEQKLFGSDFSQDDLYMQISQNSANTGSFQYTRDGRHFRIEFRHNSGLNITYYNIFNESALYGANHLVWVVFFAGICFIILSMFVTFAVTLFMYRPLQNLKQKISSNAIIKLPAQDSLDDFTYLNEVYQSITTANARINTINNDYLKEKDRTILKRLLSCDNQILPQEYEKLNQYFTGMYSQILIVSIDYTYLQHEDTDGVNLLKYAITNVMNELFENNVLYMNMNMVSDNVTFFINHNDEDSEKLRAIIQRCQQFFKNTFKITLSAGVGCAVTNLEELSSSFSSAKEALEHRFLTGNNSLQFASELSLLSLSNQKYPYEEERNIIAAIKAANQNDLNSSIMSFFNAVQGFNIDQVIRSMLQLEVVLQHFENNNDLSPKNFPWPLDVLPLLDIDILNDYITRRCQQDLLEITELKNHNDVKAALSAEIIKMVDDNIYNPNLSVVFLAEQVHLSVNYLRSIFKENTGESLSNYIIQKKLDLICSLLKDSDISLQEISDKLGFSTKNYFFTFFKKHMQMTPGEYRKTHKNQ